MRYLVTFALALTVSSPALPAGAISTSALPAGAISNSALAADKQASPPAFPGVKSLSSREITALEQGRGMGHGRAAELNHYPGPGNVLDLADELGLEPDQVQRLSAIEEQLRADVVPLGRQRIEEERRLEASFAKDKAAPEKILTLSNAIAETEAQLRAMHLTAHLATRAVLTDAQLARYEYLQGYSDALAATEPHG